MKFELVEPPDGIGGGTAEPPKEHHSSTRGAAVFSGNTDSGEQQGRPPASSIRARRSRQIQGARDSLELLRARAAELSMADVGDTDPETDPGTAFLAHRFAARTLGGDR